MLAEFSCSDIWPVFSDHHSCFFFFFKSPFPSSLPVPSHFQLSPSLLQREWDTEESVLTALFHIHVLKDAHVWQVSLWLTGEKVMSSLAPREDGQYRCQESKFKLELDLHHFHLSGTIPPSNFRRRGLAGRSRTTHTQKKSLVIWSSSTRWRFVHVLI